MNRLGKIFSFSEDSPLLFTQADFWIFFTLVYVLYAVIYQKKNIRSLYLFAVSLLFYYKTSGLFVGILIFSTILDFFIGQWVYRIGEAWKQKLLLALSITVNLSLLCYFKYAYFFTGSYNALFHTQYEVFNHLAAWGNTLSDTDYFTVDKIILPVGISFYTFQTISYSVDIYRKEIPPLRSIIDFGFFVSFFPQLVAGPIVRAADFIPQIGQKISISKDDFGRGIYMVLKGLIKKMLFADFIAMQFLDRVFDAPNMHSGFSNLMALFGYSLQIYADFSGYTDIAIGIALLLGFRLPKNFNSPYKAIHCGDFWKRWHISLSTWLKDYLYIPIGGNRKSSTFSYLFLVLFTFLTVLYASNFITALVVSIGFFLILLSLHLVPHIAKHFHTNVNILITMLIGGLWHGASWKFVIWGGLNGMGIVVYKYWRLISPYEHSDKLLARLWKIALTFAFITFTRIYFRSNSMEHISLFYQQLANNMDWKSAGTILWEYRLVFLVMVLGYITHWLSYGLKEKVERWFIDSHIALKVCAAVVVAIVCYQTYAADFQAFIYFQF